MKLLVVFLVCAIAAQALEVPGDLKVPDNLKWVEELVERVETNDSPGEFFLAKAGKYSSPKMKTRTLADRIQNKRDLELQLEKQTAVAAGVETIVSVTNTDAEGEAGKYYIYTPSTRTGINIKLAVSTSSSCSSKYGFSIDSTNDADDTDGGELKNWKDIVPSCVLEGISSSTDIVVFFYVDSVDTCDFTFTITEEAATCDKVAVTTAAVAGQSITVDAGKFKWIEYTPPALTKGQTVTVSLTGESYSTDYRSFKTGDTSYGSFPQEHVAYTDSYKAMWGLYNSGSSADTFTFDITSTDYTCYTPTSSDAFDTCTGTNYPFAAEGPNPIEGFLQLIALFLPEDCSIPVLSMSCVELYPPCDSNNMAAPVCRDSLCDSMIACASALGATTYEGYECAYTPELGQPNGNMDEAVIYVTDDGCTSSNVVSMPATAAGTPGAGHMVNPSYALFLLALVAQALLN